MASKSRSGTNPHQRVAFLREHGYEPLENGSGKGSHQVWVHPQMATLMRSQKITMPENLRSYNQQQACNVMLCSDPAAGTWKGIVAQAEWCVSTIDKLEAQARLQEERREKKREFHDALKEITTWKKRCRDMFRRPAMAPEKPDTPLKAMQVMQMHLMR